MPDFFGNFTFAPNAATSSKTHLARPARNILSFPTGKLELPTNQPASPPQMKRIETPNDPCNRQRSEFGNICSKNSHSAVRTALPSFGLKADTWKYERRKTPFCKRRRRGDAALICAHPTVRGVSPGESRGTGAQWTHARFSAHPTVSLECRVSVLERLRRQISQWRSEWFVTNTESRVLSSHQQMELYILTLITFYNFLKEIN